MLIPNNFEYTVPTIFHALSDLCGGFGIVSTVIVASFALSFFAANPNIFGAGFANLHTTYKIMLIAMSAESVVLLVASAILKCIGDKKIHKNGEEGYVEVFIKGNKIFRLS